MPLRRGADGYAADFSALALGVRRASFDWSFCRLLRTDPLDEVVCLAANRLYRSTRPAVSTIFCLPV